jgi:hypothetical protein
MIGEIDGTPQRAKKAADRARLGGGHKALNS